MPGLRRAKRNVCQEKIAVIDRSSHQKLQYEYQKVCAPCMCEECDGELQPAYTRRYHKKRTERKLQKAMRRRYSSSSEEDNARPSGSVAAPRGRRARLAAGKPADTSSTHADDKGGCQTVGTAPDTAPETCPHGAAGTSPSTPVSYSAPPIPVPLASSSSKLE